MPRCRHLWDSSWVAVLQHTPLAELAAARTAASSAGGQPEQYEEAVRSSPLYIAIQRAAAALADASRAQVGEPTLGITA